MATILDIQNLSKNYGSLRALDNLSLQVEAGNIYGILGPNGSGKTTTLGIILGVTMADSGSFSWFGEGSSAAMRRRIGAILETPNFYPYMSAVQNLEIVAHIKRISNPDIMGVLKTVNLFERANSPFRTFSLGMKQRLAIAACLLGDPEILIFDEPTNGLDPQGMAEVRQLLRDIGAQGKTILLASHIIDEVEKVCTHAAIIKKGKLLAAGTVSELLGTDTLIEVGAINMDMLRNALSGLSSIKRLEEAPNKLILSFSDDTSASSLNKQLIEKGIVLSHLVERRKSLEQEFLERTK